MPRYLLSLLLLIACCLPGCSPEAIRTRQWKRYVKELKEAPPVLPDTLTGSYASTPELEIFDELLRKYPGLQKTRTVLRRETITLPGKTVYVEVPVRADTVRNRTDRDSLMRRLETLVHQERADSELRAEVAKLRAGLLRAFNARACLPDTTVRFAEYDLTLTIKRGTGNRYGFTWQKGAEAIVYDQHVSEQRNERVVFKQVVWWRDEWFYATTAMTIAAGWLGFVRLRDAKPGKK